MVFALLAASLVECGTKSGGDPVTLWMYPVISDQKQSRDFWQKVETGFEQRYGTALRIESQPWAGRTEKLGAALMAGDGPDVVLLQPDMIPQYVNEKALLPVDDVVAGSARAFAPGVTAGLTVKGQSYGVPLYQTVTTTVYNRKLFADAGITQLPRTWDEVLAAAPKLAARGIPVLDYAGSSEETLNLTFYPLLWQAGGSVFTPDGRRSAFSSPEGIAALRFLVDLDVMHGLPAGAATATTVQTDEAMAAGRAAMSYTMSENSARDLVASLGAPNVAVGLPLQDRKRVTFGTPGALTLLRAAKKPTEARELLAYMTTPDVVAELCARSGYFLPWAGATPPLTDQVDRGFSEALSFTCRWRGCRAARR